MRLGRLFICGLALILFALPAAADACVAGKLVDIQLKPCTIGTMTVTFSLSGQNHYISDATGKYTDLSWFYSNDFYITPLSNGFQWSYRGAPKSITAPPGGSASLMMGVHVSFTTPVGVTKPYVASDAGPLATTVTASGTSSADLMNRLGSCSPKPPEYLWARETVSAAFPEGNSQTISPDSPITCGYADSSIHLYALNGGTVDWTPSSFNNRFDFATPVPEPGSLAFLVAGLTFLGKRKRRSAADERLITIDASDA